MMQLWLSSSDTSTVSGVTSGVIVESTAPYADEKSIAASRRWKRASSAPVIRTCPPSSPVTSRSGSASSRARMPALTTG